MKSFLSTLVALLLIVGCGSASAQQRSVTEQKRIIESIERAIASGEKAIASIRKDKSGIESKVRSLASQVEQRNRLLSAQREQMQLLRAEIEVADQNSLELSDALLRERDQYAKMTRESYRNYRHNNYISYIFASDDFSDIARRIVNIRRAAEIRRARIESIDSLSSELTVQRDVLTARQAELDSVVYSISAQKGRLQRDINSARADIRQMSSKERKALEAKELQEQKLSTALDELRRLSKGNSTGASFSTRTSNLNLPVAGGRVKRYMDNMAEVAGNRGAAVVSIYEGKVVDVKQNRITGKFDVYVAHGEYITSYAGLKSAIVAKNSTVKRNQKLGEVGAAVNVVTMETEYKIIFGIYPPNANQKMLAKDCFKK